MAHRSFLLAHAASCQTAKILARTCRRGKSSECTDPRSSRSQDGSVPKGNIPLRFGAPSSHEIEGTGSSLVHSVVLRLRIGGAGRQLHLEWVDMVLGRAAPTLERADTAPGASGSGTWGGQLRRGRPKAKTMQGR